MTANIWYISKYISLPASGQWGTRGFMLAREIVRRGHRCVMFASDANHLANAPRFEGTHFVETVDDVQICWVKTHKFEGAKSTGRIVSWLDFEWRLWRLPKNEFPRPDVVVISSLSLLSVLNGLWFKWRYRCRFVFEVRDIWPLTIIEEGGYSPFNPLVIALGVIEWLGYRFADAIIGTMPNLIEHIAATTRRHPPVYNVPIGLDSDLIAKPEKLPDGWAEAHIPAGKFVVCHGGTIGITNALDTLFDCARAMSKSAPDVHFLIVGEGGLRPHYEAACADLDNVTFTGPVRKQMMQSVLANADLLYFSVHPSKVWKFGMSLNKVVDYMLSARPIVGSYTGYPSMVEEGQAGSIVPAGDAVALEKEILRYRDMPKATREVIGRRGREWLLDNRLYEKIAKDFLEVILGSSEVMQTTR